MHLPDGPQLDLSEQVAKVRAKARPWRSIIALALAIISGSASAWAHQGFRDFLTGEHVPKQIIAAADPHGPNPNDDRSLLPFGEFRPVFESDGTRVHGLVGLRYIRSRVALFSPCGTPGKPDKSPPVLPGGRALNPRAKGGAPVDTPTSFRTESVSRLDLGTYGPGQLS